jgi:HAD superfamily hydrolase (TIGR01509 family)
VLVVSFKRASIGWEDIDTVLVDMDGTLLDLAFDNFFWRQVVPTDFARRHDMGIDEAMRELYARYERLQGRLEWYCLDHWTRDLGLDLRGLKAQYRHLIRYLPRACEFLASVRERGKRLVLVTNAHPDALALKVVATGLDRHVDAMVSSHALGAPKESDDFWRSLRRVESFDPGRTLLVEDSLAVLECARDFGLGATVAISQPDSGQPARAVQGFAAVLGVRELI